MNEKYDGGNAFPSTSNAPACMGMSLRDFFAASVAARVQYPQTLTELGALDRDQFEIEYTKRVARFAYRLADALIEERNK